MMNEEIMEALETETLRQIKKLGTLPEGSEEQRIVADNIVKLQKLVSEEGKLILDHEESRERLEMEKKQAEFERELKMKQDKSNKILGWAKVVIDGAAIVIPISVYAFLFGKVQKFEETGTWASQGGRKLINMISFKPFRW